MNSGKITRELPMHKFTVHIILKTVFYILRIVL